MDLHQEDERDRKTGDVIYQALRPRPSCPRVFVAEDDAEMRELMAAMLRAEGCDVVEAADGPELVDALIGSLTAEPPRPPDLVILEAWLPGMDGMEVVRRLRRFDQNTPVIVLAPSDSPKLCQTAEHLGVVCVVEYPFDYAELCETAIAALDPG